jgi:hypothetical protein
MGDNANGVSYNEHLKMSPTYFGLWLVNPDAYVLIAFVVTLQSSTDVTAASANVQQFAIRLKNGCCLLIDSIQGDNNNKNMIVLQLFTAFYSADDLKKWVLQLVNPHLAGSASYTTASNANGDGAATLTYASKIDPYNAGLLRRLQVTNYQLNTRNTGFRVYRLCRENSATGYNDYHSSHRSGPTMITSSSTQQMGRTNPLLLTISTANNLMHGTVINRGGGVFLVA